VSSIVADDTCVGHAFFLGCEPLDLRRCAEEEQADTTNKDGHCAEEVAHPSPRLGVRILGSTFTDAVQR